MAEAQHLNHDFYPQCTGLMRWFNKLNNKYTFFLKFEKYVPL